MKVITLVHGKEVVVDTEEITKGMPATDNRDRFIALRESRTSDSPLLESAVLGYSIVLGIDECKEIELVAAAGYSPTYSEVIYIEDEHEFPELRKIKKWVEKNLGPRWRLSARRVNLKVKDCNTDAEAEAERYPVVPVVASFARKFLENVDVKNFKTDIFEFHHERYNCIGAKVKMDVAENSARRNLLAVAVQDGGTQVVTVGYPLDWWKWGQDDEMAFFRGRALGGWRHWEEYPGLVAWLPRLVPYGEWKKGYDYCREDSTKDLPTDRWAHRYCGKENSWRRVNLGLLTVGPGTNIEIDL